MKKAYFCFNIYSGSIMMRKILVLFFFGILPLIQAEAKQIKALFDYTVFYAPGQGAYLETYLNISAPYLKYVQVQDGIQSNVQITLILKQGDSIIDFKKYEIASPIVKDSVLEDLYDVQRFLAPPGEYELEIELLDLNKKQSKPVFAFQSLIVPDFSKGDISDISLIEFANKSDNKEDLFYKSGYQLVPYLSNYYGNDMDRIIFYFEGYNLNQSLKEGSPYVVQCYLEDYTSKKPVPKMMKVKRQTVSSTMVHLNTFDIEELPTGDYNLVVQIIGETGDTVFSKRQYLERYKKTDQIIDYVEIENLHQFDISGDSIAYYVESLVPICGRSEQTNIYELVKEGDTTKLKKYMAFFWNKTDAFDPIKAWMEYKHQVDIVEVYYGTQIKRGFQADRGRVYLQYGAPSTIMERPNEPSSYPYEIWQYDKIQNQSNKQFVFFNRDLVTNDYQLLHSDMIGELQNYRWRHDLMQRNSPSSNLDDPADGVLDHWGGNADDFYNMNGRRKW
ncbi:MAG: GWxTD domain-containing protein [Crocinitomicaceae bacterium]